MGPGPWWVKASARGAGRGAGGMGRARGRGMNILLVMALLVLLVGVLGLTGVLEFLRAGAWLVLVIGALILALSFVF